MTSDVDSLTTWDAFTHDVEATLKRYYLQLMQTAYSDAEVVTGEAIPFDTSDPTVRGALDGLRDRVRAIVQQAKDDIGNGNVQARAEAIAAQETEYIYAEGLRMAYAQIGYEGSN